MYCQHFEFIDDYKTGDQICLNCGLVIGITFEEVVEYNIYRNDNCIFSEKIHYAPEIEKNNSIIHIASLLNLKDDATQIAQNLYNKYFKRFNSTKNYLPSVCLYIACFLTDYNIKINSFRCFIKNMSKKIFVKIIKEILYLNKNNLVINQKEFETDDIFLKRSTFDKFFNDFSKTYFLIKLEIKESILKKLSILKQDINFNSKKMECLFLSIFLLDESIKKIFECKKNNIQNFCQQLNVSYQNLKNTMDKIKKSNYF